MLCTSVHLLWLMHKCAGVLVCTVQPPTNQGTVEPVQVFAECGRPGLGLDGTEGNPLVYGQLPAADVEINWDIRDNMG